MNNNNNNNNKNMHISVPPCSGNCVKISKKDYIWWIAMIEGRWIEHILRHEVL